MELAKKEGKGQFEARVNGRPMEVRLEDNKAGTSSPLMLRVEGKPYSAELERIDKQALFPLTINGAQLNVQFQRVAKVTGMQTHAISVPTRSERRRPAPSQEGTISAPMAGRIVSVRVRKGDLVKVGDVICILEAMKMENEISANKGGTVQEVNISEGTPVNEGDVLAIVA